MPLNKDNRSYVERLFRMLKEYVFSLVGKRALAIFCHGEFSKRAIERTYPELNIVKIPYGIEPKAGREKVFSRKKKTQERTTVLFFGGIRTDKGIEQLSELTRLCPDIHFIVAGKPMGYTKSEIENLFKGRNNVELILDFIRDEDVEELFLKADILILPYNKHFAGQSGPLTISTIYRVPVVAARVGDMGEDIERYGLGVTTDSNDPLLLKEALTVILNMDLEKLQKAHDEYYLRGLWTNVGKLIEEYYNKSEIKPI
ncbi:glycosyltransferase family 4 protein [Geobacillus zalihae]|uniref:glycosyltransferase family 4 protein n=1 Tax=Geobacillus zalihae TaxID=213419 RepID=UPI0016816102|nr:glycosyltransferase family 4 protein [Geobacillus zalihae]QNU23477.1 glycosyltransferase family 4 protein [Geobacillus zalihae]